MDCLICLSSRDLIQPSKKCKHEFCSVCIKAYLEDRISHRAVYKITCPQCSNEYSKLEVMQYITTEGSEKYLRLIEKGGIFCSSCNQPVKSHNCRAPVCLRCGEVHKGTCPMRCPRCYIPIEKLSGCNHMICQCKYEFCWICQGKYSQIHYRIWNIFGCAIPGSMLRQMEPLKYPMFFRVLAALPKIVVFLFLLVAILLVYPIICLVYAVQFIKKKASRQKMFWLLVLVYPFVYLLMLCYQGPSKFRRGLAQLR